MWSSLGHGGGDLISAFTKGAYCYLNSGWQTVDLANDELVVTSEGVLDVYLNFMRMTNWHLIRILISSILNRVWVNLWVGLHKASFSVKENRVLTGISYHVYILPNWGERTHFPFIIFPLPFPTSFLSWSLPSIHISGMSPHVISEDIANVNPWEYCSFREVSIYH